MRLLRHLSALLLPLLAACAVSAQTVRWEAADGGMANALQLIYDDCAPDGQPALPAIPGATFTFLGQSENTQLSFGNGGATRLRTVTLSYVIRARQSTPVQIPAFTVKTDKGPLRVAAFNAAAPAAPLETVASARLIPEKNRVWAGEIFGLVYELSASRRTNPQITPTFDWNAAPLIAEDWSKPEVTESMNNGDRRLNVIFRTRTTAKNANTLKLGAASHLLSIQTGTIGFGIISQPRMETVSVTSDQPTIEVRPLPTPPSGFSGAVGQFKLKSKIIPEKAAVGEPVTWTVELSGTGNWPDIAGLPSREVSRDFSVVQPKAKRTPAEGKLFNVTLAEDVVLVPTKAGTYTLGPVTFTYFDPATGQYEKVTRPAETLTITTAAAPQFNLTPTPATSVPTAPSTPPAPKTPPPAAPSAPTSIPRDPLPGTAEAPTPLTSSTLIINLVAPFIALLGCWLWLAVRRAQRTDPARSRRDARQRLAQTLTRLSAGHEAERVALLRTWQEDTAVLWQLRQAAPSARALAESDWATLWIEADRAIYGAPTAFPPDWVPRAQAALASKVVPRFRPLRLFLPQNLMPFAAILALGIAFCPLWLNAASLDATSAYRKGDFRGAEKSWRTRLATTPTDWVAHHNLSLALSQQEQVGEAAAQAATAFVQHPTDEAVRWHFAFTAQKAGTIPADLARFIAPTFASGIGRLASPSEWQRALLASAWCGAGALAWLLASAYGSRARRSIISAATLLALAATLAGLSLTGILAYGLAAQTNAVIVARAGMLRSIPTETDTTQKTAPLAAGSIALAGKTFLGWCQLTFENGQTGWIRKQDCVPLWK